MELLMAKIFASVALCIFATSKVSYLDHVWSWWSTVTSAGTATQRCVVRHRSQRQWVGGYTVCHFEVVCYYKSYTIKSHLNLCMRGKHGNSFNANKGQQISLHRLLSNKSHIPFMRAEHSLFANDCILFCFLFMFPTALQPFFWKGGGQS